LVYEARTYRNSYKKQELRHFRIVVEETDLDIAIKKEAYNLSLQELVREKVVSLRGIITDYIKKDPVFLTTLIPHKPQDGAPAPVVEMCQAAALAGVGPMAAVAGLFAEKIGMMLADYSTDVIVENGGDIWLKASNPLKSGVFAGKSPFTGRIALEIEPAHTPLGLCTSSATVGHSLSFGQADAMIILSASAVLADAVATAACNIVQNSEDLEKAVDFAMSIPGISGAAGILDDKMAVKGQIKLVPLP